MSENSRILVEAAERMRPSRKRTVRSAFRFEATDLERGYDLTHREAGRGRKIPYAKR
jgi:hypothetical protein